MKHISLTLLLSFALACIAPIMAADTTRQSRQISMTQDILNRTKQQLEDLEEAEQQALESAETGNKDALEELRIIKERNDRLSAQIQHYQHRLKQLLKSNNI